MAPAYYEVNLEKDASFLREIWAWFVVGCVTIVLRYIVRLRTVGFRGFAGDDYVTLLTLAFYSMDAVLVHVVYHTGANADLTPDIVDRLTDGQIDQFILGSQCQTAAWYSYTALIWAMKFTMLFFYKRLTLGTMQNRVIKHLFWLCGVTYLAVFLTITFGCFPIYDNWAVKPLPGRKCTFKTQNLLVTVTLNVVTDAAILAVPIPLLWRLRVPVGRKLAIAALLCSGVFVIAAAVTRAALTLGAEPSALNINRWGVRETIIGILAVNLPILRPLFSRAFWRSGPYGSAGAVSCTGDVEGGGATTANRTIGGGGMSKLHHSGRGGGGDGDVGSAIELRRTNSESGASVWSKDRACGIAVVEITKGNRRDDELELSRAPSRLSTDSSDEGFADMDRSRHRSAYHQQAQRQQQRQFQTQSPGAGEVGLQLGGEHAQSRPLPTNMVLVETTYEITSEGRQQGGSGFVGGVSGGDVGCDATVTALRGTKKKDDSWRR